MTDETHQLLKRIKAFSPYFTHILNQQPSLVDEIFGREGWRETRSLSRLGQILKEKVAGVRDFQSFCLILRRFKQEEILRIAARDLGNLNSVSRITKSLSVLAQVCLEASVLFCHDEQAGFSRTFPYSRLTEGLVVLGMGKLGGEELNFSSDVDLIFIYRPVGRLPFSLLEQRQYFQIVSGRIIKAMGAQITGDHVFRVDLDIRPGGKDSDLVISFDSAVEYYQAEARTWERLALIKARPVAGNIALGKKFIKEVEPTIYRKFIDYSVLSEIRSLKEKIMAETRSHLLKEDNIKLGPGGIREIEFIVQSLQMVFGGKVPSLQEKNTLKALIRLKESQILPETEYRQLHQAYRFLRTLEHRIQMVNQQQTHSLPQNAEALERIAREMPIRRLRHPASLKELMAELERMRQNVRSAFDNLLLAQTGASQAKIQQLIDPSHHSDPGLSELTALGFLQPNLIREIIQSWRKKLITAPSREKDFLEKIYPLLLGFALQSVNPDQSLSLADRFLHSVGARTGILAMLWEKGSLAREIMDLFAQSLMLGRLFIQNPEMMDHLALQKMIGFLPLNRQGEGGAKKQKRPERDTQERLSVLRRQKSEQFLGIALEELAGRISYIQTSERLSDLADYILKETLSLAEEKLNQEVIHPIYTQRPGHIPPHPFCVLGLGKLGGQELGYLSDLDLIFVYSLKRPFIPEVKTGYSPANLKDPPKRITYHEYLVRLAQRLISYLSTALREGPGYSVDTRLRPSGSYGPLIVSLESFFDYYKHQAHNWEKQALLKARIICGPSPLNDCIREFIHTLIYHTSPPTEVREEMLHYRIRMEKERSGEYTGRINPKLGYGGMTDIEFIVQYLQWTKGFTIPELRQTNTLKTLKTLKDTGYLPEATFLLLKEAYQFLGLLDHGLQLLYDRKEDPRTYDPEELKRVAELNVLGLGSADLPSWDIVTHYHKVRQNVRLIFNRIFQQGDKNY
jgi:[glutamine synthetase] adenylyltransferase / [glutamine synthetase]-adenylyl-L-tyrosine phosphorylase